MLKLEYKGFINQSSISKIGTKMPSSLSVNRPKRYRSHSLKDQLSAILFAKEYGDRDAAFFTIQHQGLFVIGGRRKNRSRNVLGIEKLGRGDFQVEDIILIILS